MEDAILTYPLTFVYFMFLFPSFVSLFRNTEKKLTKPAQNTMMKNGITGKHAHGSVTTQRRPMTSASQRQIGFSVRESATLNLVQHTQVHMQDTMTAIMQRMDAAISNALNPRMA